MYDRGRQSHHSQAENFFKRSRLLDYKTMTENHPVAPCHIVGTLRYKRDTCGWKIFAGYTGSIKCRDRETYFASDTCEDLFKRR